MHFSPFFQIKRFGEGGSQTVWEKLKPSHQTSESRVQSEDNLPMPPPPKKNHTPTPCSAPAGRVEDKTVPLAKRGSKSRRSDKCARGLPSAQGAALPHPAPLRNIKDPRRNRGGGGAAVPSTHRRLLHRVWRRRRAPRPEQSEPAVESGSCRPAGKPAPPGKRTTCFPSEMCPPNSSRSPSEHVRGLCTCPFRRRMLRRCPYLALYLKFSSVCGNNQKAPRG